MAYVCNPSHRQPEAEGSGVLSQPGPTQLTSVSEQTLALGDGSTGKDTIAELDNLPSSMPRTTWQKERTNMHTCMYARTHAHTHTNTPQHAHTQE